jgi:hypothetical protein
MTGGETKQEAFNPEPLNRPASVPSSMGYEKCQSLYKICFCMEQKNVQLCLNLNLI